MRGPRFGEIFSFNLERSLRAGVLAASGWRTNSEWRTNVETPGKLPHSFMTCCTLQTLHTGRLHSFPALLECRAANWRGVSYGDAGLHGSDHDVHHGGGAEFTRGPADEHGLHE